MHDKPPGMTWMEVLLVVLFLLATLCLLMEGGLNGR
jgi:hypothetical protein